MDYIIPIIIGFFAGYFSGQFGIGGGFLMQPALRLVVGVSALISLGTPIPVFIVSAATGAYNYYRNNLIDMRLAFYLSITGVVGTVIGSHATVFVRGDLILLITAIILIVVSFRYMLSAREKTKTKAPNTGPKEMVIPMALATGVITGFLSGFLGLGGGFLLVPVLTIIFNKDIKTTIGTSLLVIIAYAIPGGITHYLLGHVDPLLALLLAVGTVPGAYIGSRVAIGLPEKLLRQLFGIFLLVVAVYFAIFELLVLIGA